MFRKKAVMPTLFLLHVLLLLAATAESMTLKTGCRPSCGGIDIPYPFGIGQGCFRPGFEIDCHNNQPTLSNTSDHIQVTSLSVTPQPEARVMMPIAYQCYNVTGNAISNFNGSVDLNPTGVYRISNTANELFVLGCNTLVYTNSGPRARFAYTYYSGCIAYADNARSARDGACAGVGCCHVDVPPGLTDNLMRFTDDNYWSHANQEFCPCDYGFIVEKGNYTFRTADLHMDGSKVSMPLRLDWAIRDDRDSSPSCADAPATPDYTCVSEYSYCVNSTNGPGYFCNCTKGYEGNPYLHDGCKDINECQLEDEYVCYGVCTNTQGNYTCQCPSGTSGDPTLKNGCRPRDKFTLALKVVTGIGVGVILLGSLCCGTCLALQKSNLMRTKKKFFEHNGGVILQQQMRSHSSTTGGGFKIFSTEELKKATNNFAADQILGRGGHGVVYRGVLADNSVVAIKKSKMMEASETKEFTKEMLILSQINHRNIVKLLGCCLEVEVPMLVYEYVSNGTLYQYIHGGKGLDGDTALDIPLRIGVEAAEALAYMHTSASPPIIHGDVKSANILLDGSLTAKVTDFGASKLAPNDEAEIATLVQGTCGYLDPEYLTTCKLTDKSDVYSFGVVLLELLTRKKVLCFDGPEENRSLVSRFVMAVKAGRHDELMDDKVRKEMGSEALEEVTHLVMRCLSMNGEERPGMKEVAERLEAVRRYQRHPWGLASSGDSEEEEEEEKILLGRKQQRDMDYKFRPHDVVDIEGGNTDIFSS